MTDFYLETWPKIERLMESRHTNKLEASSSVRNWILCTLEFLQICKFS